MKKVEKLKIFADLRNRLQCMQFIAENQIDEVRKTIENYPQSLWKEVGKASLLIEKIECSDSKNS